IDGASNNGVDAIRELRDTVGYMPSSGSHKIYIIDEVHMLSQSAFNALLKTLEEPPAHVFFIFATTEVQKIPATILSRCQRFDFRKIPLKLVCDHLAEIAKSENVEVSKDALWMIAKQGGGSMRDAQSLLEQMINFSGGEILLENVVQTLGLTDRGALYRAWNAIAHKEVHELKELLMHFSQSHVEPKTFLEDLMETIRNTLLVRISKEGAPVLDLPESEVAELRKVSENLSEEDLHWQFDMALKGAQDLTRGSDSRLVLEMVLLRMASAPRFSEFHQGVNLTQPERPLPPRVNTSPAKRSQGPEASTTPSNETQRSSSPESTASQKAASVIQQTAPESVTPNPPPTPGSPDHWRDFVEKVKGVNGLVGAQLENCYLVKQDGKKLILAVPTKLKFIFDKISAPEFQKKLSNYLTTFWGPGYEVEIQLGDLDSSEAPTPKTLTAKIQEQQEAEEKLVIENHPLVRSAKGVFNAEIKGIKDIKPN
ncbi:DNA polymerase III subunit gamma/tau, partial [bacterium]|nr:DNA polymerase III subunit gamma/tau [bacterium]